MNERSMGTIEVNAKPGGPSEAGPAAEPKARASPPPVKHLTLAERAALGKAARAHCPREAHATWQARDDRADPVDVLEAQTKTRVPDLVPIRYGRMLASPFAFYRGGAAIMAADLATMPNTGLHVQLCGDAHLANFGGFASPERELVLDVNDFDETLPGPWEWDVKRLAASTEIAGRDRGFAAKERRNLVVEPYLGRSSYGYHGKRVVEGQWLMQAASDILLGWDQVPSGLDGAPHDFYIRQLWDWKMSVDTATMTPAELMVYGKMCAWTLARAHARSGDPVAISAYCGKSSAVDQALADFAVAYADQNQRDFQALAAGARSGRIRTQNA
jgi:hypothetical protein